MARMRMLLGLAGCLALWPALSGCDAEDEVAKFVGSWKYTSGTLTVACPGVPSMTDPLSGNEVLEKGTTSDLVSKSTDPVCEFKLDVSGTMASALAGQMCSFSESGIAFNLKPTLWTFTTGDGKAGSTTVSAEMAITPPAPLPAITCTATGSGTLTKEPK